MKCTRTMPDPFVDNPSDSELLGTVPSHEGGPFCERYFPSSRVLIIVTDGPVHSFAFLDSLDYNSGNQVMK